MFIKREQLLFITNSSRKQNIKRILPNFHHFDRPVLDSHLTWCTCSYGTSKSSRSWVRERMITSFTPLSPPLFISLSLIPTRCCLYPFFCLRFSLCVFDVLLALRSVPFCLGVEQTTPIYQSCSLLLWPNSSMLHFSVNVFLYFVFCDNIWMGCIGLVIPRS